MSIKSLAMLKMEKNFRAIEKGYPRQPYKHYSTMFLTQRIVDENKELDDAMTILINAEPPDVGFTANVREEIADVSNCLDYLYEAVLRLEIKEEKEAQS